MGVWPWVPYDDRLEAALYALLILWALLREARRK